MAIFQAGTGYRDPTKAMSVKALQQRMKSAQEASLLAQQPQAPIPSNMAGLAHLAGVAATSMRESQAMGQEADARQRLAQVMAGIDPNAGPSQEQMAQIHMLDPDMGAKIYENAMQARQEMAKQEDAQAHALELQGGAQTFTAGQNEANRAAEEARQAALFGHQDTSAEKLATTNEAAAVSNDSRDAANAAALAEKNAALEEKSAVSNDVRDAANVEAAAQADAERAKTQAQIDASLEPKIAQYGAAVKNNTMTQAQADEAIANDRAVAQAEMQKLIIGGRSAGANASDVDAAKRISEWTSVGGPAAIKGVTDVKKAMELLQNGNITGFLQGVAAKELPSYVSALLNPEGKIAGDSIKNTVQMQLRQVLGAQFTQVEGEGFMERAFDPSLGEQENLRRAQLIMDQLIQTAANKQAEADYWDKNGQTLIGYQPPANPDIVGTLRDLAAGTGTGAPTPAPTGGGTGGGSWTVEEVP